MAEVLEARAKAHAYNQVDPRDTEKLSELITDLLGGAGKTALCVSRFTLITAATFLSAIIFLQTITV